MCFCISEMRTHLWLVRWRFVVMDCIDWTDRHNTKQIALFRWYFFLSLSLRLFVRTIFLFFLLYLNFKTKKNNLFLFPFVFGIPRLLATFFYRKKKYMCILRSVDAKCFLCSLLVYFISFLFIRHHNAPRNSQHIGSTQQNI